MASSLNDFLSLFVDIADCEIHEDFQELTVKHNSTNLSIPNPEVVGAALSFLNARDKLSISVIINKGESIDFNNSNKIEDFLNDISESLDLKSPDEEVEINFNIVKSNVTGVVSSYFNDTLIGDLLSLEPKGILYKFNQGFLKNQFLIVESQTEEIFLKTDFIYISNRLPNQYSNVIDTAERLAKLKQVGNFSLVNQYEYLPEHFWIKDSSKENEKATLLFNKLCKLFSVGFLYDITNVEDDLIKYNLNGYKSIYGEFEFSKDSADCFEEYYKIYNWCFTEGNFTDKIGLARNIISLHIVQDKGFSLSGNPYQSLLSSYKIYEKQNIKQYIEIRNKISEQLLSFNDRANKIVETFASGFQKSALALISFYISAIAIKLLGKGEFLNLFTLDATILAVSFIICSFIYFFFSLWEVKVQRSRFIDSYQNMKSRYLDLLDDNDINRILNNDKDYNADLKFINNKKRNYTIIWVSFLSILLIATIILFVIYNINQILETPIGIYFVKN